MEKGRRIPRKMKANNPCIPKLRGDATKNKPHSPMGLLERLREALFRFIMLCALSKASNNGSPAFPDDAVARRRQYSYSNAADHHHSEAVADCIEFIKKNAYSDDDAASDNGRLMDAGADMAGWVKISSN